MVGLIKYLGNYSIEKMCLFGRLEKGSGEKKESLESKLQVLIILESLVGVMDRVIEPYVS
jgi:hypothetical protein